MKMEGKKIIRKVNSIHSQRLIIHDRIELGKEVEFLAIKKKKFVVSKEKWETNPQMNRHETRKEICRKFVVYDYKSKAFLFGFISSVICVSTAHSSVQWHFLADFFLSLQFFINK